MPIVTKCQEGGAGPSPARQPSASSRQPSRVVVYIRKHLTNSRFVTGRRKRVEGDEDPTRCRRSDAAAFLGAENCGLGDAGLPSERGARNASRLAQGAEIGGHVGTSLTLEPNCQDIVVSVG